MMDADSAQPKIARLSPDPFPLSRAGSGDKTTIKYMFIWVSIEHFSFFRKTQRFQRILLFILFVLQLTAKSYIQPVLLVSPF